MSHFPVDNYTVFPLEVLIKIFRIYIDSDDQSKLMSKNYTNVLSLNRTFLEIFGPERIMKANFYALIPLRSTNYVKSFANDEEYKKHMFREYRFREFIFNLRIPMRNVPPTAPVHIIRREWENLQWITAPRQLELYNRAFSSAYEVLDLEFHPDYIEKHFPELQSRKEQRDTHVFKSVKSLLLFCTRVMNNENSIMKKYVKSFNIDLLFLDEFQTARTSKHTLFGKILEKYSVGPDNNYLSIKPKPFKVFSNFFGTSLEHFHKSTSSTALDMYRGSLEHRRASSRAEYIFASFQLSADFLFHRQYLDTSGSNTTNYLEIQNRWPIFKQILLTSGFLQLFCENKRMNLANCVSKKEAQSVLNDVFETFDRFEGIRIKRRINLALMLTHRDMEHNQAFCFAHCFFKAFNVQRNETKEFLTRKKTENFVEELVKACTINSSDHISTSLVTLGLKTNANDWENKEAFELIKPKMIVINKPARSS